MSRYTGPRIRILRKLGTPLIGLTRKNSQRRPYPPGVRTGKTRSNLSEYKRRLMEKQKLCYNYGVTEKQLRRCVAQSKRSNEPTGMALLKILESRLDSIVFRLGFAPTIPAARQLIHHGHITVNDQRVDISSYQVKIGQEISLSAKGVELEIVKETIKNPSLRLPSFLSLDVDDKKIIGKMQGTPLREELPIQIDEQLVVEFYAQKL